MALLRHGTSGRSSRGALSFSSQSWAITSSLLWLLFVRVSFADVDPVKDFCRRFYHQTAVIDRKLYIDGGLLNYNPISQNPSNFSNKGLLYQDLDVLADSGMPQLYANLTKNSSVPDVNGGILWADQVNKKFFLFGGEFYQEAPASSFSLYSYDTLYNYWTSISTPAGTNINRVSFGAGVSVSERGEGYYYGGWLSNSSVSGWNGPPSATSGLIKYKMDTDTWVNSTGPDSTRRAEGAMVYIPASDGGMLVYFGGLQDPGNGSTVGQPMDQILIYDILSSKWYSQIATGTVPGVRRRFCADVTWAADQSSYNIYLYGGFGFPPNASGYDDLYILTMPSFQWIKVYPNDGNYTGQSPHGGLSCNMIDDAQMLIIGGSFTTTEDCDAPNQFGTHNVDASDSETPWQLYSPNSTTYGVPDLVVSAVGGSAGGGATKAAPVNGWSNHDLQVLMTRKASVAVRTPTRSVSSATGSSGSGGPILSTGAIAGIAIGGGVVLIAALLGCFCFIRHKRKSISTTSHPSDAMATPGASNAPGSPWTIQSGSYIPSASYSGSPFLRRPSAAMPAQPVELSASPDAHVWYAPDGVTYDLVSPGGHSAHPSLFGGSTLGGQNGPLPKIDPEGRLWVPRVSELHVGSPMSESGYARYPEAGSIGGYARVAPQSPPSRQMGVHELASEPLPRGNGSDPDHWRHGGEGPGGRAEM